MSNRLCCIGALIAFYIAPAQVLATTYYVRAGGHDTENGTTATNAFATLTRAAQLVGNGDAVIVGPGIYQGDIDLGNLAGTTGPPTTIIGDESGKLTGDAAGPIVLQPSASGDPILNVDRAEHLTISGLTFRPHGATETGGQGIQLHRGRFVTIERCTFDRLSRGVAIEESSEVRVETSVATRCNIGLFLRQTAVTRLAHLSIAGCTSQGVMALACGSGQIVNCIFASNNISVSADSVTAAGWTCDHNVIHGTSGPWGNIISTQNIYEWNAASGQDRHSVYVVPGFVDPDHFDLHLDNQVTWPGGLPGHHVGLEPDPKIELDRDGKLFVTKDGARSVGAYAYPEPVPASGWKLLPATIAANDQSIRQSGALYSADGTLIRTLLADAAGVHELYWDGLDDQGKPVAPGTFELRTAAHDVRVRDDGYIGNSGTTTGAFDPPDATRVVTFASNRFAVSSAYDESGMILRFFSETGKPVLGDNLVDRNFAGLAMWGQDIIAVAGENEKTHLLRLAMPGNVAAFPGGAMQLPLFAAGEKPCPVGGLAIVEHEAFISLPALSIVRVIDLKAGVKHADLPVAVPADIAADGHGGLWIISGARVVAMTTAGQLGRQVDAALKTPLFVAASENRLAVIDRSAGQISIVDIGSGKVVNTIGKHRAAGDWIAVSSDALRDPRGAAFTADGRLIVTENSRVRALWPETGKIAFDLDAEFLDTAVPHPAKPEYVYSALGIYHVDAPTGAWRWLVEAPMAAQHGPGMPSRSVMLSGKPFVAYYSESLKMFDVSNPLAPRLAMSYPLPGDRNLISGWTYATIAFGKDGSIVTGSNEALQFKRIAFKGLDASGNPQFDFAHVEALGSEKDSLPRGMVSVDANAVDPASGDLFFLAKSALYHKMVPGWGADGTGVGMATPDGKPLWYSRSSGGNYMAIDCVNTGKEPLVLACKSFGGQIDLFNTDGLRLTTGNWSAPCDYAIGFVDQRYGMTGYLRADGKIGAYVEDDAIGRFARARVDGLDTMVRATTSIQWEGGGRDGPPPLAEVIASPRKLGVAITIPKVAPLKVDGDFAAWQKANVSPQIACLPSGVGFVRNFPADLLTTFRQGTALGAVAHDGKNLYVYFLIADDAMHFDAAQPAEMWAYNGIELWLEEEQFGVGFLKDGTPTLFKFRWHGRDGSEGKTYLLDRQNVWGKTYADLSVHPLARQLASTMGVKLDGKSGYALMAKIPFDEIKLVPGIAGRTANVADVTGEPGEIIRLGIAIGEITATGRQQDYKVNWPAGMMFADPSRSYPFSF